MAHQKQLEKAKYRQWAKAGLGLVYLKEGLAPFCQDLATRQQKDILQNIQHSKPLTGNMTCGACHLKTLEPDHVKTGNKVCPYRQTNCNCWFPNGKIACPKTICGAIYDCIIQEHASIPPAPYWKNTDIQLWTSDPWSIAKCFINAPGYDKKTSAADTDCTGLLHVIINNKYFHNHISCILTGPNNFSKVRGHRNNIFHSDSQELEETTANSYIDDMIAVLQDGKELVNQSYAKDAVKKLQELKNKDFIITSESHEQLLNQIKEDLMHELNELKTAVSTREEYEGLEKKLSNIEKLLIQTRDEMVKSTEERVVLYERVSNIEIQMSEQKKIIERPRVEDSPEQKQLEYEKNKAELKKQLVKFYKKKRSTVPLSPLVEENDTPLAGFYVMPGMEMVKQKSDTSHQEERTQINSLRDLFFTGSEDQQEIYLSADAGFGKTSFSKYLAITWGQACCPDNNHDCFKDEELKALANFEFVFLVLLRDSTAVCTIDEMIEQQIIKRLNRSASQCPLQDILEREKCLIILDGLDEWTHPGNRCSDQNEKIPHRYACGENCVILTTTRPWKLGVSNLKTSEINKKVELVKLSKNAKSQLEENAIRKMSGVKVYSELSRKTREFDRVIKERGLEHMQTIPLLLMYITCLWCNKIPIGDSKLDVYINIIEFLLSRTAQKHPEVHPSSEPSHSDIPEYFQKHNFCEKFYSLLTALAELAYHTLFNEERENTLVFDGSVAENYLKADDIKLSLLSGILTGSTTTTFIERKSKVSFSHKTVQEFFAAIFISSQSDAQKTVVEKCENVQSILDMSMICEFVSKMNSKMMCEISAGLMSVINEDERTREYRNRTHGVMYKEPLYNIQEMLVSCLQQMTGSENIKLCLQDFFINKDTIHDKHLQRLSKQNNTQIKSLYIKTYDPSSSLRDIIKSFCLTDLNNLHTLYYRGDNDNKKNVDFSLLLFPSLKTVSLSDATWTNDEGMFCERIETLKNVQYLDISRLTLSHEMLKIFYNFISDNKSTKQLELGWLSCIEHGDRDCKMMLNLSQHSQLKYVDLSFINLDESSLLLSRDMLNIERVVLWFIEISGECLQNMVENMKTISHLVTVEMVDIKPETEYERVKNYIRSSQTFDVARDEIDEYVGRTFEFQTRKPRKE